MKKTLKVFGIIAVVICLIASVVACNKDTGKDVKVVAISESEYASAEDAIKGYVSEELAYSKVDYDEEVREIVTAEYVSSESKGAVANDKIKLSDAQKTGFVSAEKFAVKVKVTLATLDDAEASEITQTVYILKYVEKFKFMVSTPEVGERLTNSYFKMITDASKYENCSITSIAKGREEDEEEFSYDGASEMKITSEGSYVVYYRNETRFNSLTPGKDENGEDMVMFYVKNGDGVASLSKSYNDEDEVQWGAMDVTSEDMKTVKAFNKATIEEMFSMFEYIPAAMFKMTANGLEFSISYPDGDDTYTTEYKITLSDEKITQINTRETLSWTVEETTYVEAYESETKITAFGSTTVSVPAEVTEALKQLED